MTDDPEFLQLLVHPHQIEVQEFESYDLIVDLRDAADYLHDHVPGAVSVPWSAPATSISGDRSASQGVWEPPHASEVPMAGLYALQARLASLPAGAHVLLYSGEGGATSAEVAAALSPLGLVVDVIAGGWATYRHWVKTGLAHLGHFLDPRWVRSAPGGLSQAVLAVLADRGEQVCCMQSLLGEGGLPGLVPADQLPSQDAFESRLLDVLRRHDHKRPVWFDEVIGLEAKFRVPVELLRRLRTCQVLRPAAPIAERIAIARGHVARSGDATDDLPTRLEPLLALLPAAAPGVRSLLESGRPDDALAMLLEEGTDLLDAGRAATGYAGDTSARGSELELPLDSLDPAEIAAALRSLVPELKHLPDAV